MDTTNGFMLFYYDNLQAEKERYLRNQKNGKTVRQMFTLRFV